MTNAIEGPSPRLKTDRPTWREEDQLRQYRTWFLTCRNTLHYMADLILDSSEVAECAVQNCWRRALENPPGFESEGDFRSWIFRLLINEALSMPLPEPH
jgi:DNA-directed RNA polymerase specialized sigma24 family protein